MFYEGEARQRLAAGARRDMQLWEGDTCVSALLAWLPKLCRKDLLLAGTQHVEAHFSRGEGSKGSSAVIAHKGDGWGRNGDKRWHGQGVPAWDA